MGSTKPKQGSKGKRGDARKSASSKSPLRERSVHSSTTPEAQFVADLLIRGEAAKPDEQGKLPLDATHVIEGTNPDGSVQVKRVRLKAF